MNKSFKYCFSLGCYCGVASALGKVGLRSHSGPFDWMNSEFKRVVECLKNGCADMIQRENMFLLTEAPNTFVDTKYGFRCPHDIHYDFEGEAENIVIKYSRRISRFLECIKEPTCFFRLIKDIDELSYIQENSAEIDTVVKSYNQANEIVYLILRNMPDPEGQIRWFRLGYDRFLIDADVMRNLFSDNEELLFFCDSLLPKEIIERNKDFDQKHSDQKEKVARVIHSIQRQEDSTFKQILLHFCDSDKDGLFVWGAGAYGKQMMKFLKSKDIPVPAVVDNNVNLQGRIIEETEVKSFDDVKQDVKCIFIAVEEPSRVQAIKNQILSFNPEIKIMTYNDIEIEQE